MSLTIADNLTLPTSIVTETLTVVGRKRSGKSYTSAVIAEEMIRNHLPFVVLDPTGAWWGLRATPAGKPNKSPVIIIGGAHGDLPLEPSAGKVIADLVVDYPGYYVLDLSGTASNAEQDRFACAFAERIYRRKATTPTPLHLFIDEADSFIPQRPMPGQQAMLGAFEAIVRRGGIRGLGVTLITQRAAVLNKNVMTQTECLILLQTTGPQDIEAAKSWIEKNASKAECDTVLNSLASLPKGTAWVWSPTWLGFLRQVKINQRTTYNSSATPTVGSAPVVAVQLAPADIESIKGKIMATIDKAKAEDPRELRRTIADLQHQLSLKSVPVAVATPKEVIKRVPVLREGEVDTLMKLADRLEAFASRLRTLLPAHEVRGEVLRRLADAAQPQWQPPPPAKRPVAYVPDRHAQPNNSTLSKCQKELLRVLAQHREGCEKGKLTLLAGYSWSGSTQNALGALRAMGAITGSNGEVMRITQTGLGFGPFEALPTGAELAEYWLRSSTFGACAKALLRCLLANKEGLTKEQLCEKTGYTWSGSTQNALGALRTAGVISGSNGGTMVADPNFF